MSDIRKARDLTLLDQIDAFAREPIRQTVWRVAREGRDPLLAGSSQSRWCNSDFDVLYTSLERDGALSEVYALLSSQPVFPSKMNWKVHRLTVSCKRALKIESSERLKQLGVNAAEFRGRDYGRTQEISDVAHFLDFDSLLVPSARWNCANLVIFADKLDPEDLVVEESEESEIDWADWRASKAK